jgi:hypothetical protein
MHCNQVPRDLVRREVDDMHRHASRRKKFLARFVNAIFWQMVAAFLLLASKAMLSWDSLVIDLRYVLPTRFAIGGGTGLLAGLYVRTLRSPNVDSSDLPADSAKRPEAHMKVQWISRPTLLDFYILFLALPIILCPATGADVQSLGLAKALSKTLTDVLSMWSFGIGILVGLNFPDVVRR